MALDLATRLIANLYHFKGIIHKAVAEKGNVHPALCFCPDVDEDTFFRHRRHDAFPRLLLASRDFDNEEKNEQRGCHLLESRGNFMPKHSSSTLSLCSSETSMGGRSASESIILTIS